MRCIALLAAAMLTGCATTHSVWAKDGSTQRDFNMDAGQCKAQAASIPGAPLMQIAIVYQNCMYGKGWEQREVPNR